MANFHPECEGRLSASEIFLYWILGRLQAYLFFFVAAMLPLYSKVSGVQVQSVHIAF
jgi:hypothetical protein